jgi:4-hydroxythreonine-4-phosphate dehydrogenase
MRKPIAIIAGEPNSISSEIIFKAWSNRKKFIHKPFFIIGNFNLLNLQRKKLKFKIKLRIINNNFNLNDFKKNELLIYDIKYVQKKIFEKITNKSKRYIYQCFETALKLAKKKKIIGLINCPISKESLFGYKHQGITEYLSKKTNCAGQEVMLIYNKSISVSPMTTHISLSKVSRSIKCSNIIKKVKTINNFYKKILNKKPNIAILGLNPHNYSTTKKMDEKIIISKAIKVLLKNKIRVFGPISPDSSFVIAKKFKFDIIVGMYHDQVLTPFKALYNYDAINITLGLPFIRISPDHGVAENLIGKNIANSKSLIESIKFFNNIK